jgi:hypothetical protein
MTGNTTVQINALMTPISESFPIIDGHYALDAAMADFSDEVDTVNPPMEVTIVAFEGTYIDLTGSSPPVGCEVNCTARSVPCCVTSLSNSQRFR